MSSLDASAPRGADTGPTARPAWRTLRAQHATLGATTLRQLFASDLRRGDRLARGAAGLSLDYSSNRITDETPTLLMALTDNCGLRERTAAMFRGEVINATEGRRPRGNVDDLVVEYPVGRTNPDWPTIG